MNKNYFQPIKKKFNSQKHKFYNYSKYNVYNIILKILLDKTLNSSVVVLSMTLNSCGAIKEMILWVLLQFVPLIFLFGRTWLAV